jgi:chromosome segregation ATPase
LLIHLKIIWDDGFTRINKRIFAAIKPNLMKKLLIVVTIGALFASCDSAEKEKMKSQLDSLQNELQVSQQMSQTLQEVGTLMDSIDASRQVLRVNMVEGTTYAAYTSRMKDLNNYVKETQSKIGDLEKSLKKSKSNANAYAATVKKLKADLEKKNEEIASLQQKVADLGNQNENMKITIDLQEAELNDKSAQIEAKTQELALIEAKIQELMIQSKMSEADSYFARGQAVEEAANRTKLAPRKKKDTYKEALELYKKAQSLGNDKAQARIDELSKKVD